MAPLGGVERPRRVVRFARLIHRRVRVLGGPAVRAAFGGNLSLPWLLLSVISGAKLVVFAWGALTWGSQLLQHTRRVLVAGVGGTLMPAFGLLEVSQLLKFLSRTPRLYWASWLPALAARRHQRSASSGLPRNWSMCPRLVSAPWWPALAARSYQCSASCRSPRRRSKFPRLYSALRTAFMGTKRKDRDRSGHRRRVAYRAATQDLHGGRHRSSYPRQERVLSR
jgi:hypothetical protein